MYTQCHHCLTVYRLAAQQLARARGNFRCGHCGVVFDGLERLIERLPDEEFHDLPDEEASTTPMVLAIPAMRPAPRQPPLFVAEVERDGRREPRLPGEWIALDRAEAANRAAPAPVGPAPFEPGRGGRTRPSVEGASRRAQAVRTGGSTRWWLGSLLLALGLGGQIAYAERERLLDDARVRPWLDRLCERVHCQLPLRTQIDAIRLTSREVRPHPEAPKALMISASMVNNAQFVQRFPIVEVTLSDLSDRAIAKRRFLPSEYLAERSSIERGFPAGATAPLVFEVADPGQEAVAFEFRFLPAR